MITAGQVKNVLHEAAALLRLEGWAQGSFHEHDRVYNNITQEFDVVKCDGYCMMGAVYRAAGQIHDDRGLHIPTGMTIEAMEEQEILERATEMVLCAYLRDYPTRWNDSSNRTKEEVIAALDECATTL